MLAHFYVIRRENIDIGALYQPPNGSRVGDVNWAAMASLLFGLVMTWLFLYGVIPPPQGVAARAPNGLDLSWLAGMLSAGLPYYALYRLGLVTRGVAPARTSSRRPGPGTRRRKGPPVRTLREGEDRARHGRLLRRGDIGEDRVLGIGGPSCRHGQSPCVGRVFWDAPSVPCPGGRRSLGGGKAACGPVTLPSRPAD